MRAALVILAILAGCARPVERAWDPRPLPPLDPRELERTHYPRCTPERPFTCYCEAHPNASGCPVRT